MPPRAGGATPTVALRPDPIRTEGRGQRRLLIVKAGETLPGIRARRGDFEDWIAAGLGIGIDACDVVPVWQDAPLPAPDAPAGVIVTGSAAMVSDREPWSERTAAWLADAVAADTSVLGICYGHQMLAHALGGQVGDNPRGREIGTVSIRLDGSVAGDPLFGDLARSFDAHASHVQSVLELPTGARALGESAGDPHQAFAIGARAWGVQFHPEFDADVMRGYLDGRRELLLAEKLDVDALDAAVRDTPTAAGLLRRFHALCATQ